GASRPRRSKPELVPDPRESRCRRGRPRSRAPTRRVGWGRPMTSAERLRDDLIRRSVQTGDIARWSYSPELAAAIDVVAQDSADARALEFWGVCHFTGEDWRVHLLR